MCSLDHFYGRLFRLFLTQIKDHGFTAVVCSSCSPFRRVLTSFGARFIHDLTVVVLRRNNKQRIATQVLLDTGADISIIHAEIAELLGIELIAGREHWFGGITGKGIGYIHQIDLEIGGMMFRDIPISFSDSIAPEGYGILGHEGLFNKMRLVFELGKNTIEITPKTYKQ